MADKVEPIYEEFTSRFPDLETLAAAEFEEVASLLRPLDLQNVRAQALIDIAEAYLGEGIPSDEEPLLELPYVGRYVANARLCFVFDEQRR